MNTMLEAQMLTVLQSLFEALNTIAPSLPPEAREKVEDQGAEDCPREERHHGRWDALASRGRMPPLW